MFTLKPPTVFGSAFALALGIAGFPAHADLVFSFLPTNTFSGTAPAGTLTADFSVVSANEVQLVITSNLASGENLDPGKALYLNFNDAKVPTDLSNLTFTLTANTGFSQAATVMTGDDTFKPDGDGQMDILFTYGSATKAFTTGESQTYLITDSAGSLAPSDFDFLSDCTSGCGTGGHLAAIHVQNTPSGGSGSAYVAGTHNNVADTPEPSALALLGSAIAAMGFIRRQRRGGGLEPLVFTAR